MRITKPNKDLDELLKKSTEGMTDPAQIAKRKEEVSRIYAKIVSSSAKNTFDASANKAIEKAIAETLDPKELRKKIAEIREKSFVASEKTSLNKSILFQSLFGESLGKRVSARFAKADPNKVQEAMNFMAAFNKSSKKGGGGGGTEDYVDVPIGSGMGVDPPRDAAQVKKRRTDRLSKMIYADETWEVKATELLETLLKSTGKYQYRHTANEHGNIHEKLRWIIENCCRKCCSGGGMPIPLPVPVGGRPRPPTTMRERARVAERVRIPATVGERVALPNAVGERVAISGRVGTPTVVPRRIGGRVMAEPLALPKPGADTITDILKSAKQAEYEYATGKRPSIAEMRKMAIDADIGAPEVKPAEKGGRRYFRDEGGKYRFREEGGAINQQFDELNVKLDGLKESVETGKGEYIPKRDLVTTQQPTVERVKTTTAAGKSTARAPGAGGAGFVGGAIGSILGYGAVSSLLRDKDLVAQDAGMLKEQAKSAKNLSPAEKEALSKQISAQKKDVKARVVATGVGGGGGAVVGAKVAPKIWNLFMNFVKKQSPKLFAEIATRLAGMAALASLPIVGWIGAIVNAGFSIWLAYDLYQLWKEFNDLDDAEKMLYDDKVQEDAKKGVKVSEGATTPSPAATGGAAAPKVTPVKPAAEKGFFEKAYEGISSTASSVIGSVSAGAASAVSSVKSFFGGKTGTDKEIAAVQGAGPGYTTVQTADGKTQQRIGVRNWRNNNPGNLNYGSFAKSKGAVGSDGRFAVFPTVEDGDKAREDLLFGSGYANLSIQDAISKYAPPNENNTAGYINSVVQATGASPLTLMKDLNSGQRSNLLAAMSKVEGFKVGKIVESEGGAIPPPKVSGEPASPMMASTGPSSVNLNPVQSSLGPTATSESSSLASSQMQMQASASASQPPVVINNGGGQKLQQQIPTQSLPKASPRSSENAFNRALARDFAHPSSFTSAVVV